MKDSFKHARINIVDNMSEGVMVIGFDGVIRFANHAAVSILGFSDTELVGRKFAPIFFEDSRNDSFTQAVLEAVYDRTDAHQSMVLYHRNEETLYLRVISSFMTGEDERTGIIIVFSDLSELMELRDAVKSMNKIRALNYQLELRNKLISDTFGRFLSDDIVKHLLDTPDGLKLGGTKRRLTMLMSDLRGFTAMSERMEAADLISMLNHYLAEMTEVIQSHNGTIIEFIGDGILAIFGAPEASEIHAEEAVVAALGMEERMARINKWNLENDYPELEMGIGINTGEVIVGNIGSEKRTKYGVVGSHVNLCGRIESYTVGGQILISSATKELIGPELEIAKTLTVYPKGAGGEMLLYHVTGIGDPYDIHVKIDTNIPQQLDRPIPVAMHKIEGKHGNKKTLYGGITAVSHERAILETEADLEEYDNLQINAGGRLFCKVMEKTGENYLLQYTSVPAGYAAWLKEARLN
ncbi:MAG: PAS domain-containing protein [Lachnospiraceae bacterium]|nr:PAS domain-containing protein [Lachnospiraceae bacterium]